MKFKVGDRVADALDPEELGTVIELEPEVYPGQLTVRVNWDLDPSNYDVWYAPNELVLLGKEETMDTEEKTYTYEELGWRAQEKAREHWLEEQYQDDFISECITEDIVGALDALGFEAYMDRKRRNVYWSVDRDRGINFPGSIDLECVLPYITQGWSDKGADWPLAEVHTTLQNRGLLLHSNTSRMLSQMLNEGALDAVVEVSQNNLGLGRQWIEVSSQVYLHNGDWVQLIDKYGQMEYEETPKYLHAKLRGVLRLKEILTGLLDIVSSILLKMADDGFTYQYSEKNMLENFKDDDTVFNEDGEELY